ncbi:uncharacterized protein M437DRAFT_46712 [Aureobasidium melanogenum CBS 110374]|uniref:Uncharacterized protein n=1 Tax=Aureobasidium melanogenum (strain CBS 110374) TaxID=1043003 RepID=A0A074WM39_AURM1|nr:uncharacterized protein M437DRAFT_46712 [Aureobasidium melanogenum CBS 110374]KEQ63501.1 hypothetical protein M437DRAFT_46712 [Aureobasidium melanogenum CBS 110374]
MSLFGSYAVILKPAENAITIERRESNLSEIFGICGPEPAAQPVIGLDTIAEQDPLPSTQELQALYKLTVMDRTRNKTPFIDLVQSSGNRRNIVIFIRHFFCPNCFGYVRALANELPPEKLEQMDPPTTLSIVGCGDPILIQNYMKMTDCPFDVYADPSRSTYAALGFSVNETAVPEVPKYVQKYSTTSIFKAILVSLGLATKTKSIASGKKSQNGGELIWVDGEIQYIHRMRHTNDHLEVDQLDYVLSLLSKAGS